VPSDYQRGGVIWQEPLAKKREFLSRLRRETTLGGLHRDKKEGEGPFDALSGKPSWAGVTVSSERKLEGRREFSRGESFQHLTSLEGGNWWMREFGRIEGGEGEGEGKNIGSGVNMLRQKKDFGEGMNNSRGGPEDGYTGTSSDCRSGTKSLGKKRLENPEWGKDTSGEVSLKKKVTKVGGRRLRKLRRLKR